MTAPRPCPVVDCTGTTHPAFVVGYVPSGRVRRPVLVCPDCWTRIGDGALVTIEHKPRPWRGQRRRPPQVWVRVGA